jgi:FkbM family methyltransferase
MQVENISPIRLRAPLFSLKQTVARVLCNPLVGRFLSVVFRDRIPSFGIRVVTSNKAIIPSVKASLFWRIYESAEIRFVKKYLRPDLDAIELGSSIGAVTAQILQVLDRGCRLVCVEANPYLTDALRQNIQQNADGKEVRIIYGAIADENAVGSSVNLFLGTDNTVSQTTNETPTSVPVPALSLTSILHTAGIEADFSLISDIEGAEINFILKDAGALRNCRQLIIELHETRLNSTIFTVEHLRTLLEKTHGFRMISNHGPVCVFEK